MRVYVYFSSVSIPFHSYPSLSIVLFASRCFHFIVILLFVAEADKDYETVRSKGEDEKVLDDEIHKSKDKQEREKATQKQIAEHEVFSPMTAKMKFNFIFSPSTLSNSKTTAIYTSSEIWTKVQKFFPTNGIGNYLTF